MALVLRCIFALILSAPLVARAQLVYSHEGATDPADEGWGVTPGDTGVGVSLLPLTPDSVDGLDAWSIDDASTASGSLYRYQVTLTPQQLGDSDVRGWTLRVVLRVVEPAGAAVDAVDASIIVEVSEGPGDRRYALIFGTDPNGDGDPVVSVFGGAGTVSSGPSSYTVEGHGDHYQEYLMTVDPATGLATVYVDGLPRISTYAGVDAGTVRARLNFGSGQSGSTGHGNFRSVEWSLNTDRDADGIPDLVDNCPSIQNNPNTDAVGVGDGSGPNRTGDACQCGDLTGDGGADSADVARYRAFLADPDGVPLTPDESARCGLFGDPFRCSILEAVGLRRAVAGLASGIEQSCVVGLSFTEICGDDVCSEPGESCLSCRADCGACLIGQACLVHGDCASGSCVDGICSAVAPIPGTPLCGDGICNGSESCSHIGLHGCFDDCGPCIAAVEDNCLDDSDCDEGTCTLEGRCDQSGESCPLNDTIEGTCPGELESCSPYGYITGLTRSGLCSDLATQCETGVLGIHVQDTCDSGDYCRARYICTPPQSGGCGAPPSHARLCNVEEPCVQNTDCASGVCYVMYLPVFKEIINVCTPPLPDGVPCTESSDCAGGLCNVGYCLTDPQADGSPCSTNSACQSGICNGFCVPTPLPNGSPCLASTACASGLCANGVCQADDCGDGICDSGFESCATPDPAHPFGVRCQTDCGACADGHTCVQDSDCESGACDPYVRGCLACRFLNNGSCANGEKCDNDGDCGSGNCVGEESNPYGYCAPIPPSCSNATGRPLGCGCSSNSQCASNDCVGYAGSNWCVPNSCTAPGDPCSSSSQCCDFPGYDLSCYDFNPLPFFTDYRCADNPP